MVMDNRALVGHSWERATVTEEDRDMLAIRRRGEDVQIGMACVLCGQFETIDKLWCVFRPLDTAASQHGMTVHRSCVDGQAEALMGSPRVLLWRLRDALEKALRG
jgi:hypothetical protein